MIITMQLVRCVGCESLLFSQGVFTGIVEIKCRKSQCRVINHIEIHNGIAKVTRKKGDSLADREKVVVQ